MCIMGSANNKCLKLGTEGRKTLWKKQFHRLLKINFFNVFDPLVQIW